MSLITPWHRYPTVDASDTFWRMGAGEQYLVDFSTYFASLPPTEQLVYALSYPAPFDWGQFF